MSSPRNTALRVAALASLGAGVIHLAVVGDHADTWWVSGVFFGLLTAFQLGWGLLALARPQLLSTSTRTGVALLGAGALVNGGSAVLWAVTRWITGEPFGPNAGTELPIGPAGIASAVLGVVALGALVMGPRLHARPVRGLAPALMALGLVLVAPAAWGVVGSMSHDHGSHSDGEDAGHHDDGGGHDESGGHSEDAEQPAPSPQPAGKKSPSAPGQPSTPQQSQSPEQGHDDDGHAH